MGWHDVKLYPADTVFSYLIRKRDKQCIKCGKPGTGEEGIRGLQAAHLYGRGKWNTRYDPKNCDALCPGCHRETHRNEKEYEVFKLQQLGQKEFDLLTLRAWSRSELGSNFWKRLTKKEAMAILEPLFD